MTYDSGIDSVATTAPAQASTLTAVIEVGAVQARTLLDRFADERPGYEAAAGHALLTAHGRRWVDRWPDPRVILLAAADNYVLRGDPRAIRAADLAPLVTGFVDAPVEFVPLLRRAARRMSRWQRLVYVLDHTTLEAPLAAGPPPVPRAEIRRLTVDDGAAIGNLSRQASWIYRTWGGPAGLAASGQVWGAMVNGRLASVACTFFRGVRHAEVAIITEVGYRRRGLSTACVIGLCADIRNDGLLPSWSTSLDNIASQRVAEKSGFSLVRPDVLYLVNISRPA